MTEFLEAYQKEAELDSGELWVFADMLKIALLRAVGELARQSILSVRMFSRAEKFCEKIEQSMMATGEALAEYKSALSNPDFLEHTMMLLRESPHLASVRQSINKRLTLRGQTVDKLMKKAHATQAAAILRMSGAIASLRMLSKMCFEPVFESISAVHRCLSEDEAYSAMDFDSREYYRSAVAKIAATLRMPEPTVVRAAMQMAVKEGVHVGFFIIGSRMRELYSKLGKIPLRVRASQLLKRHMLLLYVGGAEIGRAHV